MEQSHSLCESLVSQRDEALRESERLRSSFRDVERTLGTRERAHRHRVKGLEEQVHTSRLPFYKSVCLRQYCVVKRLQEMKRTLHVLVYSKLYMNEDVFTVKNFK